MTDLLRRQLGTKRAEVSHLIVYYMKRNGGHNQTALAKALGCSATNVGRVINGHGHSPLVLDGLRRLSKVPEKYLFDPRDTVTRGGE